MSLLSVAVKKARFINVQGAAATQWNSYVTLKLQSVKSTTVCVKGPSPSWEQDFLFEINNLDTGLLIEVWNKGLLWDKVVGYHYLHLGDIHHSNVEGAGQWLPIDAEVVVQDREVVGTKGHTGHYILVDVRFELPFEVEGDDQLQHKLEMLNSMLDQESRTDQGRRQHQYYIQSGVSEDSDYTSDFNYPIGQHPNSSASQFLSTAHQLATPQRSLNSSRENSYEKDDDYRNTQHAVPPGPGHQGHRRLPQPQGHSSAYGDMHASGGTPSHGYRHTQQYWDDNRDAETDPLYYNSRPPGYKTQGYRRDETWNEGNATADPYAMQYGNDYSDAQDYSQPSHNYAKRLKNNDRNSLERQETLYHGDDYGEYTPEVSTSHVTRNDPQASTSAAADRYSAADSYSQYPQGYNLDPATSYPLQQSTVPQEDSAQLFDNYNADNNYEYGTQYWEGQTSQDGYASTAAKPRKELPKIPTSKTKSSALSQDAYPVVPQTDQASYSQAYTDQSFYDDQSYYTDDKTKSQPVSGTSGMAYPYTDTTQQDNQYGQNYDPNDPTKYAAQDTQQDSWDYNGYYDEAGNFIPYDENGYYDEKGNYVSSSSYSYGYYNSASDQVTAPDVPADITSQTKVEEPDYVMDSSASKVYQDYEGYYHNEESQDYGYEYYNDGAVVGATNEYREFDNNLPTSDMKTEDTQKDTQQIQEPASGKAETQKQKLQSQSSVEYNYAYQSAENLSSSYLETNVRSNSKNFTGRSNSVTRRGSFRRQVSTRDYGLEGQPAPLNTQSFDDTTQHETEFPPNEKENVHTYKNGITVTVQESVDMGYGYSMSVDDDHYNEEYGAWDNQYSGQDDYDKSFDQTQGQYREHQSEEARDPPTTGPVHMDSLESNASEGASRDPEANDNFEAQYWQKQKERIKKIQDPYTNYDAYSEGMQASKPVFFEPIDSPALSNSAAGNEIPSSPRRVSHEEWVEGSKKSSLEIEREEWFGGSATNIERKGSQRSIKSGVGITAMNRQDSLLDSHVEEDEEYLIGTGSEVGELPRRQNRPSLSDSTGMDSPSRKLSVLNDIQEESILEDMERKSSLDVPGKDKAMKQVSFDEDAPQQLVPERVTKGMTPREKWLWAMNRICAQLVIYPAVYVIVFQKAI